MTAPYRAPKDFPFEYTGGGFFRQKGIPVGESADMRHGEEIVEEAIKYAQAAFSTERDELLKKLAECEEERLRLHHLYFNDGTDR
jgi:hypothetical protein